MCFYSSISVFTVSYFNIKSQEGVEINKTIVLLNDKRDILNWYFNSFFKFVPSSHILGRNIGRHKNKFASAFSPNADVTKTGERTELLNSKNQPQKSTVL